MNKSRRFYRWFIPVFAVIVLFGLSIGCGDQESQEKAKAEMAKVEKIKTAINQVIEEAWNKGNLDVLDNLVAEGYVYHIPPYPDAKGLEAYKERIKMYRSAFPDFKLAVEGEILIQGDWAALRWVITGTHTNPLPSIPIPPTGKKVVLKGCDMSHWKDGKSVEEWNYADFLGYLQQFGFKMVPPEVEEEKKEEEVKEEEKKEETK
jgi:steroid delta-isomerase-like uncharacterized protein